ncbi:MAG: alpha/beta hydrolase [Bacteroidales bacterium]|nr:alpha/beta hydrolase [Bacteroidales bacterium]
MKKVYIYITLLSLLSLTGCKVAKDVPVRGPEGEIAYKITLPEGFDPATDRCPMVILMHGIFSSKDVNPMPALAKGLAKEGIASIRFDFNGHGKSDGRMQDMTIEKELADARAIWDCVGKLPFVEGVGLLGHSQGGVIASMTAGRLAAEEIRGVVLIAPGSVIKEACQGGKFFNATFDPKNPPEYIRCWGVKKLGREYLLTTQQLDIYGTAAAYKGPVLLLHGDRDGIVPMWCSEKFLQTYGSQATLTVVEGENHTITRRKKEVVAKTVEFFKKCFQINQTDSGARICVRYLWE